MTLPYDKLPECVRGTIQRYIENGSPCGHFMNAVFANDLFGAIGRADETNLRNLVQYVKWIYCNAPSECYGSYNQLNKWLKKKQEEKEEQDDE